MRRPPRCRSQTSSLGAGQRRQLDPGGELLAAQLRRRADLGAVGSPACDEPRSAVARRRAAGRAAARPPRSTRTRSTSAWGAGTVASTRSVPAPVRAARSAQQPAGPRDDRGMPERGLRRGVQRSARHRAPRPIPRGRPRPGRRASSSASRAPAPSAAGRERRHGGPARRRAAARAPRRTRSRRSASAAAGARPGPRRAARPPGFAGRHAASVPAAASALQSALPDAVDDQAVDAGRDQLAACVALRAPGAHLQPGLVRDRDRRAGSRSTLAGRPQANDPTWATTTSAPRCAAAGIALRSGKRVQVSSPVGHAPGRARARSAARRGRSS